ncbi:MAG TPA: hypothetical protein PKB14_05100 [Rubrivivax sp.]|nr:hypothetical protein [Rubrivivax sp.]
MALSSKGRSAGARRERERVLQRHPYDREALLALALLEREAGQRERAVAHARRPLSLPIDDLPSGCGAERCAAPLRLPRREARPCSRRTRRCGSRSSVKDHAVAAPGAKRP